MGNPIDINSQAENKEQIGPREHHEAIKKQDLLANMDSYLSRYKIRKRTIQSTKEKINAKLPPRERKSGAFMEKLDNVRQQLSAYRDLLRAILVQVGVDIRIDHHDNEKKLIRSHSPYMHYTLMAIALETYPLERRFYNSSFLAFCADPETNHITVYEFDEDLAIDKQTPLHIKRVEFKEYSKRLADDHIDKFDIDEIAYYIERYIDKEFERIIEQN